MSITLVAGSSGKKFAFPKPVRNPWLISADDYPADGCPEEQLWHAVNYAILAPSTHNTQPWRFLIHSRDVDLHADFTRALPVLDPDSRELTISCGAALFNLRVALNYFGHSPGVLTFPDPTRADWLARVHMGAPCDVDADTILMFRAITQRSTYRQVFRNQPVSADLLADLECCALTEGAWLQVIEGDQARAAIADLIAEGDRRQWADKAFRKELASWVRPPNCPWRDGLPVATQDLGALMSHAGPLVIRTFDMGKGYAAKDYDVALHSPVLALLGTDNDDSAAWLAAGQALARVLLRAQGEGICSSFLNQPIEVSDLRAPLAEAAGRDGFPQVLLRMGWAEPGRHTPRRSLSDVVDFSAAF